MASDYCKRPKPLYADLFKTPKPTEKPLPPASWSSTSTSTLNHSFLSFESFSSGFSTPPYSDLGSSGSEDNGDFIDELTRQIAECMLLEEDDEGEANLNCIPDGSLASSHLKDNHKKNDDGLESPIQVYEVRNQPPVRKPAGRRRVEKTELAESQKQLAHKTKKGINGYGSGLGMQAVYVGGYGPRFGFGAGGGSGGSVGTGVFLPRVATPESNSGTRDSVPVRRKSGCPMVLIPTRVLQVWEEYHFSRASPKDECGAGDKLKVLENEEEMTRQLPNEWIY